MTGRKNEGFTLVELLVSILAASIVTLAATTILLLGMRINAQSTGVVTRQNTARVFMTALENMAAEGVIADARATANGGWEITDEADTPILSYIIEEGGTGTIRSGGTVLVEDVIYSAISMEESGLLICALETEDGEYELSVYCRTVDTAKTEERNAKRNAFLQTLVSQFLPADSPNMGQVVGEDTYYYQWYIDRDIADEEWNPDTPWCAMFVSWGLSQTELAAPDGHPRWFSHVNDNGFVEYLNDNDQGNKWKPAQDNYIPVPGDLIFFKNNGADHANHVGAVISVAGGYVYTIEGNVEVSVKDEDDQLETIHIVQLQKYELNDEVILGYGVLSWD